MRNLLTAVFILTSSLPAFNGELYNFATADSVGKQLKFKEASSNSTDRKKQNRQTYRQQKHKQYPVIYTNLMLPNAGNLTLMDGVAVAFGNKFSAGVDSDDAIKLWNFSENIALFRDRNYLAIEFRPLPKVTGDDTLFYKLFLRHCPYVLKIFSANFPKDLSINAYLVDRYLNSETRINLSDTTLYSFEANSDTNSYRDRFMLTFRRTLQIVPHPLPAGNMIHNSTISITNNRAQTGAGVHLGIDVYPNPAADAITITIANKKEDMHLFITNSKGQLIWERKNFNGSKIQIPVKDFSNGIYFVTVRSGNQYKMVKLIKT